MIPVARLLGDSARMPFQLDHILDFVMNWVSEFASTSN